MSPLDIEDRVKKVIDRLTFSTSEVAIPGTTWKFVDFYELPSGQFKMVAEVSHGRYIDIRVEPAAKLRVARTAIQRALEAEADRVPLILPRGQVALSKESEGLVRRARRRGSHLRLVIGGEPA